MAGRTPLDPGRVLATMEEMGTARLDDLAEFLGYHRTTVERKAGMLVAEGKLNEVPGVRGIGGKEREYRFGDGSTEQGAAEFVESATAEDTDEERDEAAALVGEAA